MSVVRRLFRILRSRLSGSAAAKPTARPAGEPAAGATASPPPIDRELAELYANLEIPYGSDLATARSAWKRLVKRYHPDLHGSDAERQRVATELVKGLNHAFEELRRRLQSSETTDRQKC